MFKRYAIQTKVVKEQQPTKEEPDEKNVFENVEAAAAYAEIAKDFITHSALTIGGVWIACKIVGRLCK